MESLGGGAVGGGAVATVLIGLMVWLVKKLVNSALENMKANTRAINANTEVTQELVTNMKNERLVREEKERNIKEQLGRIEAHAAKAATRHDTR